MTYSESFLPAPLETVVNQDVVFDMDGTLLEGDLGETFFFFRLLESLYDIKPDQDWNFKADQEFDLPVTETRILLQYEELLNAGEDEASFLLAYNSIERHSVEEMRGFGKALLEAEMPVLPLHFVAPTENHPKIPFRLGASLRPGMFRLASLFQEHGARVWIVSATSQGLCEGLGDLLGIPRKRVLAVVVSEDGSTLERFPWREKKVEVLREAGIMEPYMVFGDTMGDADMLAVARFPLVMSSGSRELLDLAAAEGWTLFDHQSVLQDGAR